MFILNVILSTIRTNQSGNEVNDDLIYAIGAGDKLSFEKLYQLTRTSVYGFALSILKNPQDAEDVMQDAYLQIHFNAASYTGHGKPMAWILTIVRNLCMMRLREGKKLSDMPELEWEKLTSSHDTESAVDIVVLKAALQILTEEERQIVTLHALSGCKHREIAEILQIPLPTVLSKYNRALKKLKKELEGGGIQ